MIPMQEQTPYSTFNRSEEHTSELQLRRELVCRLLLEKKNSGATSQSYTVLANGSYAVIISQNGCVDTSSCYAITSVGMHENNFSSEIQISPNPVIDNA